MTEVVDGRSATRTRIVDAAARLLQEQGAAAVTTRGVAEVAGVQAPTIYRLFGDKDGLLDAVAEHVFATYVSAKAATVDALTDDVDPLDDLRAGWQAQLDFGLANPMLTTMLTDPARGRRSTAARAGLDPAPFSGHSMRAGFATSAAAAGVEERVIMKQTRHRSVAVVRRYIREGELFARNLAAELGL